jgi:hypothetical protein
LCQSIDNPISALDPDSGWIPIESGSTRALDGPCWSVGPRGPAAAGVVVHAAMRAMQVSRPAGRSQPPGRAAAALLMARPWAAVRLLCYY